MAGRQGHDACPLWNPPDSGEMTAGWAEQGLGEVISGYFGMGILEENGGNNREALRHENVDRSGQEGTSSRMSEKHGECPGGGQAGLVGMGVGKLWEPSRGSDEPSPRMSPVLSAWPLCVGLGKGGPGH